MFLERSLTNAFQLSICPENSYEIIGFFTHQFSAKFAQKILAKLAVFFCEFVSENPVKFACFFHDLPEALIRCLNHCPVH